MAASMTSLNPTTVTGFLLAFILFRSLVALGAIAWNGLLSYPNFVQIPNRARALLQNPVHASGNRAGTPLVLSQGLPFGFFHNAFPGPASESFSSWPPHAAGCGVDRPFPFMNPDAACRVPLLQHRRSRDVFRTPPASL